MSFFSLYGKELFSFFITILTWILNNRFKSKAKLSYGYQHGFTFLLNEPLRNANGEVISNSQLVYTRSIILVNEGRESATNISLVFNYKPMHINFGLSTILKKILNRMVAILSSLKALHW